MSIIVNDPLEHVEQSHIFSNTAMICDVSRQLYSGKKPEKIIDGCNAWFYDDMTTLVSSHLVVLFLKKASFGVTPTVILFGYTRSIPRDVGNTG